MLSEKVPVLSPSSTVRNGFPFFAVFVETRFTSRTLGKFSPLVRSSALISRTQSGDKISAMREVQRFAAADSTTTFALGFMLYAVG
jgi:hypothetical protein